MISATPWMAATATLLACMAWASLLLPSPGKPSIANALLMATIIAIVVLPIAKYPGWYYVRGVLGDSSVTGLGFYLAYLLRQQFGAGLLQSRELKTICVLLTASALLLYPFSLGLTQFDSYGWGYSNPILEVGLLATTLLLWVSRHYLAALIITAGVVGFHFRVLESTNLWDYLIDPMFLIFAPMALFRIPGAKHNKGQSAPDPQTVRI